MCNVVKNLAMEYTNVLLSVFLLFISKVLADGETKGYLRREHSIFKGEVT